MADEEKPKAKGHGNMGAFWAKLSPEEKKAFVEKRAQAVRQKMAEKAAAKLKKEEAERIKNELIKQRVGGPKELIQVKKIKNELHKMGEKDYLPSWDSLNTAISLTKDGKDLEAIRLEFFPHIAQDIWNKFKKAMFSTQISSPEDVGNELLVSRDFVTAEIKREVIKMQEEQKLRPTRFHNEIVRALAAIHQIHSDTAKRLVDIGAVGTKRTGGISVQIVNYIPRPDKPIAHDKKPVKSYITTAPKELQYQEQESDTIEIIQKEKIKA